MMKNIVYIDDTLGYETSVVSLFRNKFASNLRDYESANEFIKNIDNDLNWADLILLDIMMPLGDDFTSAENEKSEDGYSTGIVLYDRIRNKSKDILIIIVTARNDITKEQFDDTTLEIIFKPVTVDEIIESINKFQQK